VGTGRSISPVRIGTAGWSVAPAADAFPAAGSHLERYATRLACAEIDSSFYHPHRAQTYARWAASTPPNFRFAVKAPRAITHEARLTAVEQPLEAFLAAVAELGEKLGPILIQLPPSLAFDRPVVDAFLQALRVRVSGPVVLEPRHLSWFEPEPDALLSDYAIARVAADPARCPQAAEPGGWVGLRYWRLHGSPKMYATPYGPDRLQPLAETLDPDDWCIFDNTLSGAAIKDALDLQRMVGDRPKPDEE